MRKRTQSATNNYYRRSGSRFGTLPPIFSQKNPLAAARAARAIAQQFELLETEPEMGRPWEELPKLRELLIPFGDSGYVALYRHEPDDNALYVLAFRHQKEAGY